MSNREASSVVVSEASAFSFTLMNIESVLSYLEAVSYFVWKRTGRNAFIVIATAFCLAYYSQSTDVNKANYLYYLAGMWMVYARRLWTLIEQRITFPNFKPVLLEII